MTKVKIRIAATVAATIELQEGESLSELGTRDVDIYLHGHGSEGSLHKEDLGTDEVEITICEIIPEPETHKFVPLKMDFIQKAVVRNLLEGMCNVQESLEYLGLPSKEISWSNDLYSAVNVSLGNAPDGDEEQRFYDEESCMTYEDMVFSIRTRIENMIKSVPMD